VAELANAPGCFPGGDLRKFTLKVRILPLQPTYYMDVGDLVLQAFMSVLIGMMVYLWFLSHLIPHGQSIFEIQQKLENTTEKITPP
tara:strand:+ start:3717 stop:3974 length:258 start_codon:yes stop_codon:yes gene_type:complete